MDVAAKMLQILNLDASSHTVQDHSNDHSFKMDTHDYPSLLLNCGQKSVYIFFHISVVEVNRWLNGIWTEFSHPQSSRSTELL